MAPDLEVATKTGAHESANAAGGDQWGVFSRRFSQDIKSNSLQPKFQVIRSRETTRVLFFQVFIPFLLSGFGNVALGLFFNHAQTWQVYRDNSIFYMLLATVMFKTNIEATLAARLSTCSNLGSMKTVGKKFECFLGNLALVLTQSVIFGLMAGVLVVAIDSTFVEPFNAHLALRTVATSVVALCVNEFLSTVLILFIVIGSELGGINPDNLSTVIAAMWGDFSSVFFISITAATLHSIQNLEWIFIVALCLAIAILPFTIYVATHNSFTRGMFKETHLPLALAVIVSTISGLVFERAVQSFGRLAIYQAVINGLSVNLMAVQTSRIATYLAQLKQLAPDRAHEYAKKCNPFEALYGQDMNASVARWLIAMCVPAMSVYLGFIVLVAPSFVDATYYLIAACLVTIVIQVTLIQCLTYIAAPFAWRLKWDPDNVVIPVLLAISDVSGNTLILTAFMFLRFMNDPNSVAQVPEVIV